MYRQEFFDIFDQNTLLFDPIIKFLEKYKTLTKIKSISSKLKDWMGDFIWKLFLFFFTKKNKKIYLIIFRLFLY